MVLIFVMNAIFAAAIPLIKCAVAYASPGMMVGFRMLCGGGVLCLYAVLSGADTLVWREWRTMAWAGLVNFYVLCMLEAYALQWVDATVASLVWAQLPLITAWLRMLGLGERLSVRQWGAILCAVASGVLLAVSGAEYGYGMDLLGVGMLVGSVIAAAYGYIPLQKTMEQQRSVSLSHGYMMLGAGALALATAWMVDPITSVSEWGPFLWYTGASALLVNAGGLVVQGVLLQRQYSPLVLALSSIMTPVFGICYGVGLLGEAWRPLYGAVICGVALSFSLWGWRSLGATAQQGSAAREVG